MADSRITFIRLALPTGVRCTRVIDAADQVITPSFVDLHTHSILTIVCGVAADFGFAPSCTPGIPEGTQVTPAEARVPARLVALEALMFGLTLIDDNFVCADATTEVVAELGVRLAPSWRVHDVDFAQVAEGRWQYGAVIGEQTLQVTLDLDHHWIGHSLATPQVAAHAMDTCPDRFLHEIADITRERGLRVSSHLGQSRVEVERVRAPAGKASTEVLKDCGLLNDRVPASHRICSRIRSARWYISGGAVTSTSSWSPARSWLRMAHRRGLTCHRCAPKRRRFTTTSGPGVKSDRAGVIRL